MNPQEFLGLLEDAGLETRSYSGRNMYGSQCVAFEAESESDMIEAIIDVMSKVAYDDIEKLPSMAVMLKGARTDSMGRGLIIYFPKLAYPPATATTA